MRLLIAVLVSILVFGPAAAGAAPTVHADVVAQGGDEPAVVIPDQEPAADEDAWTIRFLVPTLLVAALALVVLTAAAYRNLKRRYRVVE